MKQWMDAKIAELMALPSEVLSIGLAVVAVLAVLVLVITFRVHASRSSDAAEVGARVDRRRRRLKVSGG